MNKAIAFVKDEKSITAVLYHAQAFGITHVLFFSEEPLTVSAVVSVTFEYVNISEFAPVDLDHMVLGEIDKRYGGWMAANAKLKNRLNSTGLSSVIRMSFDAIIFQYFRRLVLIDIIIKKHNPNKIVVDHYWASFIENDRYDNICICDKERLQSPSAKAKYVKMIFSRMNYTLLTVFGGIIFPVLIGKFVNFFSKQSPLDSAIVLIGADQTNKSFNPVWQRIVTDFSNNAVLKNAEMSPSAILKDIREGKSWVDGVIELRMLARVVSDFLSLAKCYFKANLNFPLQRYEQGLGKVKFASDFSIHLDYFFLRSYAKALLSKRVSLCLNKKKRLQAAVFTIPSTASRSLSLSLKEDGVTTVTTTHGMVLEPIAYRSEDSIKLTWGAFDSKLLESYSHDKHYIGLPANPEAFKKPLSEKFPSCSSLKTYGPGGMVCQNSTSTNWQVDNLGKIAIIFPSTNHHGQQLGRFLSLCLNYLQQNSRKHKIDCVIIKPKKHPRTSISEFDRIITSSISNFSNSFQIPIVLTWDIEINEALRRCNLALCAHSSILLDCIRCAVPFSVYTYGSLSNKSFLEHLPDWMTFENESQLDGIQEEDLENFDSVAKQLMDIYWGGQETEFNDAILSFTAMLKQK